MMLLTVSTSSTSLINIPIRYLSFFMAIANVHFDEYLLVRKNLLISSKSIKPESLDDILGDILKKETTITSFFKYADVIIEPNRIEYVANVDGRSGNHSNL